MGPKVTALEERRGGRVAVFLDGREAFTLPAEMVGRLGLEVGSGAPDERFTALRASSELERARDAALRLLAVRARSESELRDRLRRKGATEETTAAVIEALERVGLLDDRAFARLWIEERVRLRPVGRRRALSELRAKGIPREMAEAAADEVYAEHPEEQLAERAIRPKLRRPSRGENASKRRRRLHSFLLRRGFSYEVAARILNELPEAAESDEEA